MGCIYMEEGKQTWKTSVMITSAFEVPFKHSYSSCHEWRDGVFHLTELSYGLVLVSTWGLGLLGVNGVPFVPSVICAGI